MGKTNRKRKGKGPNLYPVGLFALDESDPEFLYIDERGRRPRVVIEQVDGDKFFFRKEEDARVFIEIHGLKPVPNAELERLRADEAPRPEDDEDIENSEEPEGDEE